MRTTEPARRRRQLGADRRTRPNPVVPPPASSRSLALGRLALAVTALSWLAYVVTVVIGQASAATMSLRGALETLAYLVIVTFLALSAGAYLITRQGYLRRTRAHSRTPRAELEAAFGNDSPSATVLIPSYREQPEVILQTMFSAALQELPNLRVVLLVDDPPRVDGPERRLLLEPAREVPGTIAEMLEPPRQRFVASLELAEARMRTGSEPTPDELGNLADDYEHAVAWLEDLATAWVCHDHTDDFFVDHVLRSLARDLSVAAAAVRGAVLHRSTMSGERFVQLHRRLTSIFTADLASFERKQYLTLSHEPNKAMNLNAYIGLMGGSYCEQTTSAGGLLLRCEPDDPQANFHVPASDYIVTLDADSVLLPEYCIRLIHLMEQPGNERVGVIQTPYSAFTGAPTRVERIAGATTDIQHIVHQGMAEQDAAFWVGANAVLRMKAVEALRVDDASEGHVVSRFISDRTVIEDTESTLDLTTKGWSVTTYPERLAYSASPPDFGSLCIQRQRWANGGLIILRKLAAHWRAKKERGEERHLAELLLRLNYLASITWATAGLGLLLAYPFSGRLMSALVIVMSAPYFVVMASDLKRCGYKRTDVLRIYGFNLIMLPVNASGVLRSIGQMITGHKVAFARTPKVRKRTVAPATFVIFPYLIIGLSIVALIADVHQRRWPHAVFAGTNVLMAVPATLAIIGLRCSLVDVWIGLVNLLRKPARLAPAPATLDPVVDWAAVLYHGSIDEPREPHRDAAPASASTLAPVPASTLALALAPAGATVPALEKELVG
ncbi:MAG: glycosyltransferase [Acidimicrobiales bacterium]|nr:glycosyltransferase [Acidimicrobiales bacterium]